jgi:hypothetical protein
VAGIGVTGAGVTGIGVATAAAGGADGDGVEGAVAPHPASSEQIVRTNAIRQARP